MTEQKEKLFQEWWESTGFDSDYMDEKCARRIWDTAYRQGRQPVKGIWPTYEPTISLKNP